MDTFGFVGDPSLLFNFSVPNVNFAESDPSVSTPVASATCLAADISNTTPLASDSAANFNPFVHIPDEYPLPTDLGDENLWDWLPLLEDPVEGHHLLPEPHVHQVENEGLLNAFNAETNVVPPDVSRSSTSSRWQNFVWLIRACYRFSHAAAASLRAKVPKAHIVFKGVMEKKGKFVCETRVMKKIQLEKKRIIKKVWLGTYETQDQAARALDVGKYFFNAKETKTFFDPNTETMLSTLSQQLLAQPLDLLVKKVKEIAKYYGTHGTLP